jgi:ribosomal protein S12 methylthiotransferase accessory factor
MSGIQIFGDVHTVRKEYFRGTHRARPPSETIAEYRVLMPRVGMTRLANITGLDCIGIPVYVAFRPNGRCLATSQGKGLDHDAAKASALMESLETWHAETLLNAARWESYQGLLRSTTQTGDGVIDPATLPYRRLPLAEVPRAWILGFDIMNERPCWVPLDAVSLNFVGVHARGEELIRGSDGLASGNHLLEAVVHGLCELIERDAEDLWRLSTSPLRQLDLSALADPYCREVYDRLTRAGVLTAAWDLTSDVGIPAYGSAIMERPDPSRLRSMGIHYGWGCHLAPHVALSRALTEAVQTRLTYISGSRDDLSRHDYQQNRDPDLLTTIWDELTGDSSTVKVLPPSRASDSFEGDVRTLLDALRCAGLSQVVVVDLTRQDIGLPVVKLIVPGLGNSDSCPGRRAREALRRQAEEEGQAVE